MKLLIAIALAFLTVGCASNDLNKKEDGNLTFFTVESGVGVEGGPVMKSLVVAETKRTQNGNVHKVLFRDTHSGPGTLQRVTESVIPSAAGYFSARDHAPYSVTGDNTTIFDVDGGSAGAQSESNVGLGVSFDGEDTSYEISTGDGDG